MHDRQPDELPRRRRTETSRAASPWRPLSAAQGRRLIAEAPEDHPLRGASLEAAFRTLPFYGEGTTLARVRRRGSDDPYRYCLVCEDEVLHLDGTSPPVHRANALANLVINEDTALTYLWFFCFYVRGEDGPFYVLTDADDPMLPEELLEDPDLPIARLIQPPTIRGVDEAGRFLCDAQIFYGAQLFAAKMAVAPSGMIEMTDDDPMLTDMPASVYAPLG